MNRLRLLLAAALLAGGHAHAVTTCRLVTGGGVGFGGYDPSAAAPTDTALNLQIRCDRSGGPQHITVTIGISTGTHGTSVNNRRMLHAGGSGDYLLYGLFRDVGRSSAWGTSPGVDAHTLALSVPNNSSATGTITIYGRIPAQQNVSAGGYGDSVQVTVSP